VTRFLDLKGSDLCKNRVVKGNLEMVTPLLGIESEEGYQQVSGLIENHLEEQWNKIKQYIPSLLTQVYVWVRNPYSKSFAQHENLSLRNFVSCNLIVDSR
jgi:hypothetical protein